MSEANPLGLDASAFVPQEATDAFERSEIVVSCVLGPGKGADRRCSLIVSIEPPTDIPHRNLGVLPHSAACTLAQVPEIVAGLLKDQEAAFGEAWVKAWTEQQKLKAKTKVVGKPKAAPGSPAKVAVVKPALFGEEPEPAEPDEEDEEPEAEDEVEEAEAPSAEAEQDEPEAAEAEEEPAPAAPAKAEAPAAQPAPATAQMSLLGGIEL
jgi:hypothetical protein